MKSKKIFGIGAALCVAGILLTGVGMVMGGKPGIYVDKEGVHSVSEAKEKEKEPYVMKKTKLEGLHDISIKTDFAKISLIPSDDFYLEYRVSGYSKVPTLETKNGTLVFEENPSSGNVEDAKVYFLSVNIAAFYGWRDIDYYVNLYYPEDTVFDTVSLKTDDGTIEAENLSADTLKLYNSYGDIKVSNLKGNDLDIILNDGNFTADVIETEKFSVLNDYGDIKLDAMTGGNGEITLKDGKFKANMLEAKEFILENTYGDIEVGRICGGSGGITLDDGDFEADVVELERFKLENDYGEVKLGNLSGTDGTISLQDGSFTADEVSLAKVELSNISGNISIGEYSAQDGQIGLKDGTLEMKNADFENLQVRNSYGDVQLSIPKWKDYTMDLKTEYGEIILPEKEKVSGDEDEFSYYRSGNEGKQLEVSCNDGTIEIKDF